VTTVGATERRRGRCPAPTPIAFLAVSRNRFTELDTVSIRCADAELAQTPSFSCRLGSRFRAPFGRFLVKLIHSLDEQIRYIRVVTQLARRPADGTIPRKDDGLIWERNDLAEDGVHPSESGRRKVAEMLLNFFKTDSLAATWFVKER
jgi:lysophospholipase L1-like esterase